MHGPFPRPSAMLRATPGSHFPGTQGKSMAICIITGSGLITDKWFVASQHGHFFSSYTQDALAPGTLLLLCPFTTAPPHGWYQSRLRRVRLDFSPHFFFRQISEWCLKFACGLFNRKSISNGKKKGERGPCHSHSLKIIQQILFCEDLIGIRIWGPVYRASSSVS